MILSTNSMFIIMTESHTILHFLTSSSEQASFCDIFPNSYFLQIDSKPLNGDWWYKIQKLRNLAMFAWYELHVTGKAHFFLFDMQRIANVIFTFQKSLYLLNRKYFLSGARSYFITLHLHLVLASETSIWNHLSILVHTFTSLAKKNKSNFFITQRLEDSSSLEVFEAKLDEALSNPDE